MQRYKAILASAVLSTSSFAANALEPTEAMINYNSPSLGILRITAESPMHHIKVIVNDQVKDGCWMSPETSKTAAELELKRSQYPLAKTKSKIDHSITLSALGYAINGGQSCVVAIETVVKANITESIRIHGEHRLENLRHVTVWRRKSLMNGPKESFESRLREGFTTHVQAFLMNIGSTKADLVKQTYNTVNVNFREPRSLLPSKRMVSGEKLEELRGLWRNYFNSYVVKDGGIN